MNCIFHEVQHQFADYTTVVVLSPKAWTFYFPASVAYLRCRLSHLPVGSMPAFDSIDDKLDP